MKNDSDLVLEVEVMRNTLLIYFKVRGRRWKREREKSSIRPRISTWAVGRMELPLTEMKKTVGKGGLRRKIKSIPLVMKT